MKLASVSFRNFKSYSGDATLDLLPSVTVLIGPNNVGKSNVLQLLTWYREALLGQAQRTLADMVHTGHRGEPLVTELEFALDRTETAPIMKELGFRWWEEEGRLGTTKFLSRARHTFEYQGGISKESVDIMNVSGDWMPMFGWNPSGDASQFWQVNLASAIANHSGLRDVPPGNRQQLLNQPGKPQAPCQWPVRGDPVLLKLIALLREYAGRWHLLPPVRQLNPRMPAGQDAMVQQGGGNLVRVLNAIQGEEPTRFVEMMKDIYGVVPELQAITAPLRGNEATVLARETGGVRVEAHDTSTGLQQTLILVTSLLTFPRNSLILIEEPEIHLHPGSQRALGRLIRRMTSEADHQFLMTTHSTIFAEIREDTSTYLVEKREGASTLRRLSERGDLLQLKQALGHENTDLFGFNGLILVEGHTEEAALPLLAASLGIDFPRLGLKLLNLRGKGKTTRIEELLRFLQGSDTAAFVMLDGGKDIRETVADWIRGKLVKEENVFIWPREFEDCFDDQTLANAMRDIAKDCNVTMMVDPVDLAAARTAGKSVCSVLEASAFKVLGHGISKPEFGEAVAQVQIAYGPQRVLSAPEAALVSIASAISPKGPT